MNAVGSISTTPVKLDPLVVGNMGHAAAAPPIGWGSLRPAQSLTIK
jgi:hypothetical protein